MSCLALQGARVLGGGRGDDAHPELHGPCWSPVCTLRAISLRGLLVLLCGSGRRENLAVSWAPFSRPRWRVLVPPGDPPTKGAPDLLISKSEHSVGVSPWRRAMLTQAGSGILPRTLFFPSFSVLGTNKGHTNFQIYWPQLLTLCPVLCTSECFTI